jgi:5,10-methylenetetrahydrofolate reductase
MFEEFIDKLQSSERFLTLETTPKHSASFEPILDRIEELKLDKRVDGFSVTDSPLAKLKYSSMFAAIKLQERFKKPTLATLSMRDRNKIALQSDILGANEFGVRVILALTGDPATASDQPKTKGVFEGNSTMLLDMIKCLNSGIDYAGKPLDQKTDKIYPFAVSNAFSKNPKNLLKKMKLKLEHGAVGIITQPVYDIKTAEVLLEIFDKAVEESGKRDKHPRLILGFFPITKLRVAQFLTSHVPGVYVPRKFTNDMYEAKKIGESEQERVGFELSLKLFNDLRELHPNIHIMAANNFGLVDKILNG